MRSESPWHWSDAVPPPSDQPVLEYWGDGRYAVTDPQSGRDWSGHPDWYLPIPPAPRARAGVCVDEDARARAYAVGYGHAADHLAHCACARAPVDLLGMRVRMSSVEYEGFLVAIAAYLSQAIFTGHIPPAAEWEPAYPTLGFRPSAVADGDKS